jgi:glycosyltransferase involved in cell wall biosynthesis
VRVLQLGPYPPPHGGVQSNLVAIRHYLLARGIPCAVINLTRHRKAEGDGVYYPRTGFGVLALLLRLRYDVIHLHVGGRFALRLVLLGLVCTLLPWAKAVLTLHSGGYPSSPEGRAAHRRTLRGFVLRRFDCVIGVNPQIVGVLRAYGCAPERTRLIWPYALPDAEAVAVTGEQARAQLPTWLRAFYEAHSPVLLTVGLLEPEYDLGLQVEALGRVRERFPGAGLVIAGDGSLAAELQRRIAEVPYAPHVLLGGDVPHATTLRAMAASDLLLRTTRYDGDSVAVREALHLGTPVIATDNGMRPPGVRLIPAGDVEALRRAIEEELGRRSGRAAPREAGGAAGEDNLAAVMAAYRALRQD